jgi:hypothetical protein
MWFPLVDAREMEGDVEELSAGEVEKQEGRANRENIRRRDSFPTCNL